MPDPAAPPRTAASTPPPVSSTTTESAPVRTAPASRKRKERDADADVNGAPISPRPAPAPPTGASSSTAIAVSVTPADSPPSRASSGSPAASDGGTAAPTRGAKENAEAAHTHGQKNTLAEDGDVVGGRTTGGARPDEYEAGRVVCEACGGSVSFRDGAQGGFTLRHWEAHRVSCPAAPQGPPPPAYAAASAHAHAYPSTPRPPPRSPRAAYPTAPALHPSHTSTRGAPSAMGLGLGGAGASSPKRRRAKRTEDERIAYLRSDPYVAQFEAYRVLCASCDKWIRLRPNSTYCSIPWDAHRKSCLAKKVTAKNPYALSERNTLFAKDPDVRKFDPERLLCNLCDRWIALPPDDHLGAVQTWLGHRATCGRRGRPGGEEGEGEGEGGGEVELEGVMGGMDADADAAVGEMAEREPDGAQRMAAEAHDADLPNGHTTHSPPTHPTRFPPLAPPSLSTSSGPSNAPPGPASSHSQIHSPTPPYLLTPLTYAPSHESRRRNAEQRAATLRADRLIGKVEPNRVFCSLCQKWVQLRQDSSYCAYPWVQHRGKCLRRSERRNAKAAEMAHLKNAPPASGPSSLSFSRRPPGFPTQPSHGRAGPSYAASYPSNHAHTGRAQHNQHNGTHNHNHNHNHAHGRGGPAYRPRPDREDADELMSDSDDARGVSDSGSGSFSGEDGAESEEGTVDGPSGAQFHEERARRMKHRPRPRGEQRGYERDRAARYAANGAGHATAWDGPEGDADADAEGEVDIDVDADGEAQWLEAAGGTVPRRAHPAGLADLDSPEGRHRFIHLSLTHLFRTTYESSDELSVSALLAYLNAAMPPDKHEDFDTAEVARAARALAERGRVVFEGDVLRVVV